MKKLLQFFVYNLCGNGSHENVKIISRKIISSKCYKIILRNKYC